MELAGIFTCCQLARPARNLTLLTSGIAAIHKHNCNLCTLRHVRAHFCPALSDILQNTAVFNVFNVPKLRHPSIHLSIDLSICLSIYQSINQSSPSSPFLTPQQFSRYPKQNRLTNQAPLIHCSNKPFWLHGMCELLLLPALEYIGQGEQ